MTTDYDRYQAELHGKEWSWDDMPFYRRGRDNKVDILPIHELDYLDVYEKVYGRKMGCNGIGKLKEVALTRITETVNQIFDDRYPFTRDRKFLEGHGNLGRFPDIALAQKQQENYAKVLEENGVTVRWIDWPERPMSAFGPMQAIWAAQELLVINGGAIVPKNGWHPFSFGRTEWLSRWAFWNLNIPTLLTITGKGVCEAGATAWLAQDIFVAGLSTAYNQEGLDQLLPVVRLTAGVKDLKVLIIRCQGRHYFDERTGASGHVTNVIAPLDLGKVIAHIPGIDTTSLLWLRRNGFEIVECDPEEQIRMHSGGVINHKILEPGLVIMAAEAKKSIKKVRDAGVEVIEVPYSGFGPLGGGFHCSTMEIHREPGPSYFS